MNPQIASSTISKSNQLAVPALLKKLLGLEAGDKILWNIDPINKTAQVKIAPKLWGSYMSGLGSDTWKGVDVEKYIKDLRQDRKFE